MSFIIAQRGSGSDDEGTQALFTHNNSANGVPGTDPSDAPFNGRQWQWIPLQTLLKNVNFRVTVAPGGAHSQKFRTHDDDGTNVSGIITLADPATLVSSDVEANIAGLDTTSDTTIRNTRVYQSLWPQTVGNAAGIGYRCYEYECNAHPEVTWLICGVAGDTNTSTYSNALQYSAIIDKDISSAFTTQSAKQCVMPLKGKLKYAFAVWRGIANGDTVRATIQKGALGAGSSTLLGFTMTGIASTSTYQGLTDLSTEVTFDEGDYLNWMFTRSSGASTAASICVGVGLIAL